MIRVQVGSISLLMQFIYCGSSFVQTFPAFVRCSSNSSSTFIVTTCLCLQGGIFSSQSFEEVQIGKQRLKRDSDGAQHQDLKGVDVEAEEMPDHDAVLTVTVPRFFLHRVFFVGAFLSLLRDGQQR